MTIRRTYIRCEVKEGCRAPAWFQLRITGVKASEREPTNTCRACLSTLALDFVSISNDVRMREAM